MAPITRSWTLVVFALLVAAPLAQSRQTFTGVVADSECGGARGHALMRMGPTDADCTLACVAAHGASYVLAVGKDTYKLSDQKTPEKLAGLKVQVVGALDAKTRTIKVESIAAAK